MIDISNIALSNYFLLNSNVMKAPFSSEQFFGVFEKYNESVFPVQILFIIAGLFVIFLLHKKPKMKDKFTALFLACMWLWAGAVYHIGFFTGITPAAYVFGAMFLIQGLIILILTFKNRIVFNLHNNIRSYAGYFFMIFGLILYPATGWLSGEGPVTTISSGLPCPTTIMTFGLIMIAEGKSVKFLLIIPVIWTLIGVNAALNFGVYQDFMMVFAAIIAIIYRIPAWQTSNKRLSV